MNSALPTLPDFAKRMDPAHIVDLDLVDDSTRQQALRGTVAEWAKRPPFYTRRTSVWVTVCSRAADVREMFTSPDRFSVEAPAYEGYKVFDIFGGLENVLQMEGERHDRIRRLMNPAFTPQAVMRMSADIDRIIAEKVDHVAGLDGRFDAVKDFCHDIIVRVMLDASFKLTPAQQQAFIKMHDSISLATQFKPGEAWPAEFMQAVQEVTEIISQVVAERRANPGDDMISNLVTATDEGRGMTESELFGQINSICSAGIGTTASTLAGALLMLGRHPDQLQALRDNPELVDGAVEESLRCHGPGFITFTRFATRDTELGGVPVFKDMPVVASIQAADFDPDEFPEPLAFDIRRNPKGIFAFGAGPHHCIGNRMARMVLRKALMALINRFPNLRLADPDFEPVYGGFPGELSMTSLPMRFD